uniref:Uncharacterized protein n=1 Tax=Oryza brachyantha TaxID=4533 RepID=J3LGW5_ORYBR
MVRHIAAALGRRLLILLLPPSQPPHGERDLEQGQPARAGAGARASHRRDKPVADFDVFIFVYLKCGGVRAPAMGLRGRRGEKARGYIGCGRQGGTERGWRAFLFFLFSFFF